MSEIDTALGNMRDLVKTISGLTASPDNRVWIHPGESDSISLENLPAVVVTKADTEPGSWIAGSYGVGRHEWTMLIAVYLEEGPIIVTNSDEITVRALKNASEWYKALSDLLYANLTISGSVKMTGDDDGMLFEYVTDNIIWNGKQYWGHLFLIPVAQEVVQSASS